MIEGQSFIYYGPEPWQSMWRNRHHLLSRLARANRVLYMEPWPSARDVAGRLAKGEMSGADLRRPSVAAVEDGLWVYRWPLWAPFGGGTLLRPILRQLRGLHLRRTLSRLGMRSLIIWASHPDHALVRFDLPARLRVYHIVDEYLGYHGVPEERRLAWRQWEGELIDWADLVVAVSPQLIEAKGRGSSPPRRACGVPGTSPAESVRGSSSEGKFRLLPNGVALDAYRPESVAQRAPALADLPRPILGYVGLVSVRLDLAMLDALAVEHPEWALVLLGTVYPAGCGEEIDRLRTRSNVRLLPPVSAEQVPDYVRSFDLGLVPYQYTIETQRASPLKVYEYLAAGLPVASSDVPGVRQVAEAPLVSLVPEVEAGTGGPPSGAAARRWGEAIAAALASNTPELAERRRHAVAAHSWDARVETLSGYLGEALARTNG